MHRLHQNNQTPPCVIQAVRDVTVSDDPPADAVLSALEDEYARAILTATDQTPMTANELADVCDASLPTIYRRLERLTELDLLDKRTQFSDEHRHYNTYRAALDRLVVELNDGELHAEVETEPSDPADRFTQIWEEV